MAFLLQFIIDKYQIIYSVIVAPPVVKLCVQSSTLLLYVYPYNCTSTKKFTHNVSHCQ